MQVKVLSRPVSPPQGGKAVHADRIASLVGAVPLEDPLEVRVEPEARHGDVVLARVIEVNPAYPMLETNGQEEVDLEPGQTILGVLGSRKALQGFSGDPPARMKPGMELFLLNRGGVIGECSAFHRDLGWPTRLEYVGTLHRENGPVNLKDYSLPMVTDSVIEVPVILVVGTCMNAGKTTVCKQLVQAFSEKGFTVHAGKVAGVGCLRDPLAMKEAGAREVLGFHDFGIPSTAHLETVAPVARSIVHHLSQSKPDFILLEMGDGVLGGYHVYSLFEDKEFMNSCVGMIVCANDYMGVWGVMKWMSQQKIKDFPILVSGPVTDSAEGVRYIEEQWKLPAGNAFDSTGKICSFVLQSLMPWLELE